MGEGENHKPAAQHGEGAADAGRVHVSARRVGDMLEISVEDDGPGIDANMTLPEGHGLANTRERLRALYGDRASIEVGPSRHGTIAMLRVPYRDREVLTNPVIEEYRYSLED